MRTSLYVALCLVVGVAVGALCHTQTDGFALIRITPDRELVPDPGVAQAIPEHIKPLLCQPFTYLGHGGQSFVFVSADQSTVLKVFKHPLYKPFSFLFRFPLPLAWEGLRRKQLHKLMTKMQKVYASYALAYEKIPDTSALLYLHIHPDAQEKGTLSLIDRLGVRHEVPLNQVEFVLQRKVEMLSSVFSQLQKGEARPVIRDILALIQHHSQLDLFDEDQGLHRNLGFEKRRPLLVDVGKLRNRPQSEQPPLKIVTHRLRTFFAASYPEYVSILDEEVSALDPYCP